MVDLSLVGPASRATRILADYGAEVVKVLPGGRAIGEMSVPPFYAYSAMRYMKQVNIDLKSPEGLDELKTLVSSADVLIESFRPGVTKRLGIDFESISKVNPAIIYCSTTGFGQNGERSSWVGHDINYLACGGFLAMSEPTDQLRPPLAGATIADGAAGGMQAAISILAALFRRTSTHEGTYLDVSITNGVLWLTSLVIDEHLAIGSDPEFGHDVLSGKYACYGIYKTKDNKWLSVGAIEKKFFSNLCGFLGCDDLCDLQYIDEAQGQVRDVLSRAFETRNRDEWVELLSSNDTCVAPVLTVREICDDQHFKARGLFQEALDDSGNRFTQLAPLLAGMRESESIPDRVDEHCTSGSDR